MSKVTIEDIKPGQKILVDYGKNHPLTTTYIILAIVDDNQVVYKYWHNREERYYYKVEPIWEFEFWIESGILKKGTGIK